MARCFLFVLLAIAPARLQAQSPAAPIQIPHKLTLADAERILLDRNLIVPTAKYQVKRSRAASLIASKNRIPLRPWVRK